MDTIIQGKAYVLGKNIDTDQIIPAEHLVYSLSNPEEVKLYGKYALSGVPPEQGGLPEGNIPFVEEGDAPFALKVAGAKAIIAESYARIFYRNCVDGGFVIPYETTQQLNKTVMTGDELALDMEKNTLTNLTQNITYELRPLGDVVNIVQAGGIFEYARKNDLMALSQEA